MKLHTKRNHVTAAAITIHAQAGGMAGNLRGVWRRRGHRAAHRT